MINKISADLYGCRLYVALFPCNECAKVIIQSGITEVIYLSDKYLGHGPGDRRQAHVPERRGGLPAAHPFPRELDRVLPGGVSGGWIRSTFTGRAFISGKPLMGSNTSSGVSRFTLAWR